MGNTLGKILALAFWIVAVINLINPLGAAALWINGITALLVVAHSIECIVFRKQIQADPNNNALTGYVLVFLFGVLHAGQWTGKVKS
ncbi:MAG: hypothetical protein ACI9OO_000321 [Bacteroidia bacterium]|jgi:uncharacterized protein YhhL (DUF1145 family)